MDKLDHYFTQTIVGMPRRYTLGTPSSNSTEPVWAGSELQGAPGRGFPGALSLSDLRIAAQGLASPLLSAGRRRLVLGMAALGAAGLAAAIGVRFFAPADLATDNENRVVAARSEEPKAFPIQPAADAPPKTTAISVEAFPFAAPAPLPKATVVPPGAPMSQLPTSPVKPAQPAPPPSKDVQKEQPASLLIMDGAGPPKADDKKPAEVAQRGPTSQQEVGGVMPASPPAISPARADDQKVTVVDIAKDGSFVLITNPRTRLPERFTVGQKIFSGETIQKIDVAGGKVQLDKRSVGLQ